MKQCEAERISSLPVRTLRRGSHQRGELAEGATPDPILAAKNATIGAAETEACLASTVVPDYTTSPGSVQTTLGDVEGEALHKKPTSLW